MEYFLRLSMLGGKILFPSSENTGRFSYKMPGSRTRPSDVHVGHLVTFVSLRPQRKFTVA